MRKSYVIIILVVVAFLCAVWSPWNNWRLSLSTIFGLEPPQPVSGLTVNSLAGKLTVYIDGETQPSWQTDSADATALVIPRVKPGERQIRLVRESEVPGAYWEFNEVIPFEAGLDVVLTYELGPTEEFSGGHYIYATPGLQTSDATISLNVDSDINGVQVFLDGQEIGLTPLAAYQIPPDVQHRVVLAKGGYESQELTLLPEDAQTRAELAGYNLYVVADLFLLPIEVN